MVAVIEWTTEIARTPEEVFDYLSDQGNEPAWNPDCISMEKLTDGPVGVGTRFRAKWTQGPAVITEVTAYDRPWTWTYTNGGSISCVLTCALELTATGGTRMTSRGVWSATGVARLFFPVFIWIMRRAERKVMANACRALEERRDGGAG